MSEPRQAEGWAEIEAILDRGGDVDDVLRRVLDVLAGIYGYAALELVDGDELVAGPSSGEAPAEVATIPVAYEGSRVGALVVPAGARQDDLPERVADAISAHVLLSWDTGGEAWEP